MAQSKIAPRRGKRLPKGPNGGVQLLLIHSVENLGKQGEIVEVKSGYANNFLVPYGLATLASDHHLRMVEKHREKLQSMARSRLKDLEDLAKQLGDESIIIEERANEDGHLYGSVTPGEIAKALRARNYTISEEMVVPEGAIRELGRYSIPVQLHSEVTASITLWVIATDADTNATPDDPAEDE